MNMYMFRQELKKKKKKRLLKNKKLQKKNNKSKSYPHRAINFKNKLHMFHAFKASSTIYMFESNNRGTTDQTCY